MIFLIIVKAIFPPPLNYNNKYIEMQINFNQHANFKYGIKEFAEQELSRLDKYQEKIERADIYYKIENTPMEQHLVEIKLAIPGTDLFAHRSAESYKKAFVQCVERLETQLKKRRERIQEKR